MSDLTPAIIHEAGTQWLASDLVTFFKVVRKEWRLVLISMAVCLTLAMLYIAGTKRMYLATSRILVLQQSGRPLSVSGADSSRLVEGVEDYLPTYSGVIRSPAIVGRAIDSIGLKNLPTLEAARRGNRNPIDAAIEQLSVSRPDRTAKILRVNYLAGSKEEAVRTVRGITDSYNEFLEESYRQSNNRVVPLISKARDELKNELEVMQEDYLKFRKKNPLLTTDESGRSFVARRLDHWDRLDNQLNVKAMELETQLQLGRNLAREGSGMWAVAHALGQLGNETNSLLSQVSGSANILSSDYVRQLSQEQQKLSEQFGPGFSKVQDLQDQITRVQERMHESKSRIDQVETRDLLRSVAESLDAVKTLRKSIAARFSEDMSKAKEIEIDLVTDSNLRGNLERQRTLFNTVVDQLKQAQLSSDFSSVSSRTIEPANAYPGAVKPRVTFTLFIALFFGTILGVMAALVADRLDTRLSSLEAMRTTFNYKMLGVVPLLPKAQALTQSSVGLLSHALPQSLSAEAYKSIRTNIEMLRRQSSARVVLLTSPHSGDGKSTTASNLAITIAQVGRRVLLVDADLRRPTQDRIHGLDDRRGLVHVLKDLLPLEKVVQESVVENLSLIAAGPEVSNPAELLASAQFTAFLERARQLYDLVLIDSSPLLLVADPAIIGPQVDGIVVVVRDEVTRRYDAERATELLNTMGTPVLGFVVNGFNFEKGGRNQHYGYGYGAYGRDGRAKIVDEPALNTNGQPHETTELVPTDRPDPE